MESNSVCNHTSDNESEHTSDDEIEVRFVYHEYDYRPNWTTRSLITNILIIKITISEKRRIAKL